MQTITNDGRSQAQPLAGEGNCPVVFKLPFYFSYWDKNRDCCQHLRNFQLLFPKIRAWPCRGDLAVCGVSTARHHREGTQRAFLSPGVSCRLLWCIYFPFCLARCSQFPFFFNGNSVPSYTEPNSPSLPPVPHPKSFSPRSPSAYFKAPQDSFAIAGPQLQ